jgi:hypothetical protein
MNQKCNENIGKEIGVGKANTIMKNIKRNGFFTAVVMKYYIFWDITSKLLLTLSFMLVSSLSYSSTLKMEATCSPEK